jgi:hypothetical protein
LTAARRLFFELPVSEKVVRSTVASSPILTAEKPAAA